MATIDEIEKAVNILIASAKYERQQKYAIHRNLYLLGLHTFRTESDYKSYEKISKAIDVVLQQVNDLKAARDRQLQLF